MGNGIVFRIKRYALHDGPGIRTTVFLKGCPLNCWWCHNPEGIAPRPQMMKLRRPETVGTSMSVEQVMEEIEKDRIFFDESGGGVTFSGGEPLYQPQFLEELLRACNQQSLHTTLDTSGYAPVDIFNRLVDMVDLVLFDIKLIDKEQHRTYTSVDNQLILKNFQTACCKSSDLRVRLPLVPGITDQQDNIRAISGLLLDCGRSMPIELLPYHRIGEHKYVGLGLTSKIGTLPPTSRQGMEAVKTSYQNLGLQVSIEGQS